MITYKVFMLMHNAYHHESNTLELEKLLNEGWVIDNSIPTSGTQHMATFALIVLKKEV